MSRYDRAMRTLAIVAWAVSMALFVATGAIAVGAWTRLPADFRGTQELLVAPLVVTFSTVGAMIVWQQPANRVGRLLSFIGLFAGVEAFSLYYAAASLYSGLTWLPGGVWALWLTQWSWAPPFILVPTLLPALFPDGSLPSTRWRPFVWFCVGLVLYAVFLTCFLQPYLQLEPSGRFANPVRLPVDVGADVFNVVTGAALFALAVAFCLGLASVVVRWRRAGGQERQQIKWFGFAIGIAVVFLAPGFIFSAVTSGNAPELLSDLGQLGLNFVPIAIGMAVLRYRLYDIDIVISRSVVYVSIAAFITGVYVAIVVGLGTLIGSRGPGSLVLSIVATALVAVAFEPVRDRVQRFANRLVYGERVGRYEALAQFSHRLSVAPTVEQVLPTVAEAAGTLINVKYTRASLFLPSGERHATWGVFGDAPYRVNVPITYEGAPLGELHLRCTSPFLNEPTGRVLRDFAAQAGLLFQNVRLTLELEARLERLSQLADKLRASRQRIVTAADAQRRSLESEIRVGTEEQLTEIESRLHEVERLLLEDPPAAAPVLDQLIEEANEALEGLRELARGVFPPLLVDKGVPAALNAHIRKQRLPVELILSPELESQRLSPQLEAALYFCCTGALQEAARLGATGATIRLSTVDSRVQFAIDAAARGDCIRDSALEQMNDRVEALGGSLTLSSALDRNCEVSGWIPLELSKNASEATNGTSAAPSGQRAVAASQAAASLSGPNSDLGR